MKKAEKEILYILQTVIAIVLISSSVFISSTIFSGYFQQEEVFTKSLKLNHLNFINDSDPFQLLASNLWISYNGIQLSLSNLTITFMNGTEISQAGAEDNVTINIYNRIGFSKSYSLIFDNETYNGWGTIINTQNFPPRTYFVDLFAISGEYHYNETIYSYKDNFEIYFGYVYLVSYYDNETMVVLGSASSDQFDFLEYILLEHSIIYAYILDETDHMVRNVSLNWTGFIGFYYTFSSGSFNVSELSQGYYYAEVVLVYDEEFYLSPFSDSVYYGEQEPTTPTPTTPVSTTLTSTTSELTENTYTTVLSVICILAVSYLYSWRRNKIKNRKE